MRRYAHEQAGNAEPALRAILGLLGERVEAVLGAAEEAGIAKKGPKAASWVAARADIVCEFGCHFFFLFVDYVL